MLEFKEGHQKFTFDPLRWTAVKYDGHPDYCEKIAKQLGKTKGVDFVALQNGPDGTLYWIEVKDFRGHRVRNKQRLSEGDLATEVAQKVRDSIAGIIGAYRESAEWETWKPFVRAMWRKNCPIRVLLWLEEDPMRGPQGRRQNAMQVQADVLAKRLRWLTTRVFVVNRRVGGCPDGLVVADLPGAGQGA